ncbi:hypothetical protein [Chondrinema litorale]|uniref:hypothetical protein n=1 Tax=Chondrinema litorale TaxID=2994555 RepID=UPI0025438F66|nr:hypothetical protein [Chondrinema litorale]UZS00217.1 hypothetical protein OQ292_40365 [Chondrinema litorale]
MKYGIFIIESLGESDDKDGKILKNILDVCCIESKYSEINTKSQLIEVIEEFQKSEFRYLHISCHANVNGFGLNDKSFIKNSEFSEIIGDRIPKRRIFMSACEAGNIDLAGKLITINKIYSLIGSPEVIGFDKSLLFYPTLYHILNEHDEMKMKKKELLKSIRGGVNLFNIPIHYYAFLKKDGIWNENEIREYIFKPNKKTKKSYQNVG